jgi:1,4-dihydroxy-2-naphthoyl-CoA hydrolase
MSDSVDQTAFLMQTMPFGEVLGITNVQATPEQVTASIAWDAARCTAGGILHGGLLMGLADSVGGLCAFLNLPPGARGTATIESKTNFLRPVASGAVHAIARPLHIGRTTIVVDTELRDNQGRLVARTTQTQAVLPGAAADAARE